MLPKRWARVKQSGAHNLRRGAWYAVVNEASSKLVVLDVNKRNVPIPRESVQLADVKPDVWSVVKFDPARPVPARISHEKFPLTYGVCPKCRARAPLADNDRELKCDECGNTYPVDWENPC